MDPQQTPAGKLITVEGDEIGITVDSIFLSPDTITDEQITDLGPALVSEFEHHCKLVRIAIQQEAIAAVEDLDEFQDKLRMVARRAKGFGAQLGAWNDRLGKRATPGLRELEHGFGVDSDFILKSIHSTPEQRDSADWWKPLA